MENMLQMYEINYQKHIPKAFTLEEATHPCKISQKLKLEEVTE